MANIYARRKMLTRRTANMLLVIPSGRGDFEFWRLKYCFRVD